MHRIPLARPSVSQAEIDAVSEVLRSGWLSAGPKTVEFEQALAGWLGVSNVVAVNSCTSALHLTLVALGIGPGDEVITSPITFVSTVNAILYVGATPVLADVDPVSMNIRPGEIARRISPRTKAIIPVHMAGQPCDMDEIHDVAKKRGIPVVEDAAHALGASYRGRKIGTLSRATCFSFYASKNLTAGDGGAVATEDEELAQRVRRLRFHGISSDAWKRYGATTLRSWQAVELGYKANFTDVQAALALSQLSRFEHLQARRRDIALRYRRAFEPYGVTFTELPSRTHANHLFVLKIGEREFFRQRLAEAGVATGIHFPAVHLQPYFRRRFGDLSAELPVATLLSQQIVSIPLYPDLTDDEVAYVIDVVTRTLDELHTREVGRVTRVKRAAASPQPAEV